MSEPLPGNLRRLPIIQLLNAGYLLHSYMNSCHVLLLSSTPLLFIYVLLRLTSTCLLHSQKKSLQPTLGKKSMTKTIIIIGASFTTVLFPTPVRRTSTLFPEAFAGFDAPKDNRDYIPTESVSSTAPPSSTQMAYREREDTIFDMRPLNQCCRQSNSHLGSRAHRHTLHLIKPVVR